MRRLCIAIVIGLGVLYLLALVVFLVGTFGLFGSERDPLEGVFLVPLGWPWNSFVDAAPKSLWPWLAAASPLVNLFVLAILCRLAVLPER